MKLILCPNCHDSFVAIKKFVRTCSCGNCAAKYLKDNITTVVNEGAIVYGIDNISFSNAIQRTKYFRKHEDYKDIRIDSFFSGWIPSVPGEVIIVDSVKEVKSFPYWSEYNHTSTNPTTDIGEQTKTIEVDNTVRAPKKKKWGWLKYLTSGP